MSTTTPVAPEGAHYEFTGESLVHTADSAGLVPDITPGTTVTLYRIRATRDLHRPAVRAGDIGGWIEGPENIQELGWVSGEAKVYHHGIVHDRACARDRAEVYARAVLGGTARMYDNSTLASSAIANGGTRLFDNAMIWDGATVTDSVCLMQEARVRGDYVVIAGSALILGQVGAGPDDEIALTSTSRIGADALILHTEDILSVGPIGSEGVELCLYQTREGYSLNVGCWRDGRIEDLSAEVDRRSGLWLGTDKEQAFWRAQYAAALPLLQLHAERYIEQAKSELYQRAGIVK